MDLLLVLESRAVWTIDDLGELLKISPKTLYKQAAKGKLPHFKVGTCVRVYGKGLADYLRTRMK